MKDSSFPLLFVDRSFSIVERFSSSSLLLPHAAQQRFVKFPPPSFFRALGEVRWLLLWPNSPPDSNVGKANPSLPSLEGKVPLFPPFTADFPPPTENPIPLRTFLSKPGTFSPLPSYERQRASLRTSTSLPFPPLRLTFEIQEVFFFIPQPFHMLHSVGFLGPFFFPRVLEEEEDSSYAWEDEDTLLCLGSYDVSFLLFMDF